MTANRPIPFLITIDTEGDNVWNGPRAPATRNADALPRFQELCEKHGLRPTYLVNYEMARATSFQEFGRDVLRRDTGSIGMHLHAWNSPPEYALTEQDTRYMPYLIEYPVDVMRKKIVSMTALLQDTFQAPVISHRAGRWAFNGDYARILLEQGYRVDCSVTPHVDWRAVKGHPEGRGGTDYRGFPEAPYWVDADDVSRPGSSSLLEIPVTVRPDTSALRNALRWTRCPLCRRLANALHPPCRWLRPKPGNRAALLRLVDACRANQASHLEMILHSSELLPGGSPYFPRTEDVEALYDDLACLFAHLGSDSEGMTLEAYHTRHVADVTSSPEVSR
ncbi:MAG: deacetylase [Spartobacteria bacterium]|nr:deacetylase [Spartobacteria bacterium]